MKDSKDIKRVKTITCSVLYFEDYLIEQKLLTFEI